MQSSEAAGQARFDGAERHVQNFGDFVVGTILQIKQGDGRLINFVQPRQRRQHLRGVKAVDGGRRHDGQFRRRMFQFNMRKARLLPARAEKFAVEGGEQPGFHFGCVAQLVAFGRPDAKSLLRQVAGIRLVARQAEGELIQRLVITGHQTFKIHAVSHIAASIVRASNASIVPASRLPLWASP